jgi:hypothetical protein
LALIVSRKTGIVSLSVGHRKLHSTMASSVVAELETGLQGMLSLKPPGVSGSRITNITALCVANVQVSRGMPIRKACQG